MDYVFFQNKRNLILSSAVFILLFFSVIMTFFVPFWETNDDVAMSMIAHGYGISAYSSPGLIFSNIIWGKFLTVLPSVHGILPYSYVLISVLLLSFWAILLSLIYMEVNPVITFISLSFMMIRPLVAPQFTVVAGMAAVGGVLALIAYTKEKSYLFLSLAMGMLFLGFLIRAEELILVIFCALPFLPWKKMYKDRLLVSVSILLLLLMIFLKIYNFYYYRNPAWTAYNDFDPIRIWFTDFQVINYFIKKPELLTSSDYSISDLNLIRYWFFVDPKYYDPVKIGILLKKINRLDLLVGNIGLGFTGLFFIFNIILIPFVVFISFVGAISKNRTRLLFSAAIFFCLIFALGLAGRPGVCRVDYPMCCLIMAGALLYAERLKISFQSKKSLLKYAVIAVLFISIASSVIYHNYVNSEFQRQSGLVKADITALDKNRTYIPWGRMFPYTVIYPVFGSIHEYERDKIKLFPLGWSTLTPYSSPYWKYTEFSGMLDCLLRGGTISIIMDDVGLSLLGEYMGRCHNRNTIVSSVEKKSIFTIYNIYSVPILDTEHVAHP